ncbi:hypothetical protein PSY31_24260, partial [Shigella flexneri]|nr:hypothetical protein [Shigella flexneri]
DEYSFALEKYLKEYSSKERTSQLWQCNQSGSVRCHNCEVLSFDECSFALEKYLKEYSSKERTSQLWQ